MFSNCITFSTSHTQTGSKKYVGHQYHHWQEQYLIQNIIPPWLLLLVPLVPATDNTKQKGLWTLFVFNVNFQQQYKCTLDQSSISGMYLLFLPKKIASFQANSVRWMRSVLRQTNVQKQSVRLDQFVLWPHLLHTDKQRPPGTLFKDWWSF